MPSYGELAQMITALAAVGAVIMGFRNSRKLGDVHLSLNSRLDQMLKDRGEMEHAKGVKQEFDREKKPT